MTERAREEPPRAPLPIGTPVTEPDAATRDKGGEAPLDKAREVREVPRVQAADLLAAIPVGFGALAFALGALGLFGAAALWRLRAPGVFQVMTPSTQIAALGLAGAGCAVVGLGLSRRAAWARRAAAGVGVMLLVLLQAGLPGDVWIGAAVLALTCPLLPEARELDGSVRTPSKAYLAAASWGVLAVLVLVLWPELHKAATILLRGVLPAPGRQPLPGLLLALAAPASVVLPAPLATARSRIATVVAHLVGALVVLALALAVVRGALA